MKIRILVSRHSSFYSPLIAAVTAGFLVEEGLEPAYSVLGKDQTARDLIRKGVVDVVQAAVGSNWGPAEKGEKDLPVHFAQINQRDGFFLAGRQPDPAFNWKKLEGKSLLADHGGQPLIMLKYAAHCQGVDWNRINVIDAGSVEEIDAAFRDGRGDYVHQQGPAPQQLEIERIGHVVAAVGEAMPPVAFSSLMASPAFIHTEMATAFLRAYRKARLWVNEAPADEVAAREAVLFPGIDLKALSNSIARYQKLGCWEGDLTITRELYDQALNVFLYSEAISTRHPYEEVVVPPPG
jgi:NitT/TauT family transport system substrate-binding protein